MHCSPMNGGMTLPCRPVARPRRLYLSAFCVLLPSLLTGCRAVPSSRQAVSAEAQQPIRAGSFWATPRNCGLIHDVRPVYPAEAKKSRIQGEVKLRMVVSKTGEVANLDLVSGDPALVPAALAAVKQWQFAPCRLNGDPIEVKTEIIVPFSLNQ